VMPPEVLAMLTSYGWPGNIRELKNFVERFMVFAPGDVASAANLLTSPPGGKGGKRDTAAMSLLRIDLPFKDAKQRLVEGFEIQYCRALLKKHGGNMAAAAREGGIHRKYMEELVKKHGLK
jgi:two-component system, NtrC family, nitrogen regulation response regulator GlnG